MLNTTTDWKERNSPKTIFYNVLKNLGRVRLANAKCSIVIRLKTYPDISRCNGHSDFMMLHSCGLTDFFFTYINHCQRSFRSYRIYSWAFLPCLFVCFSVCLSVCFFVNRIAQKLMDRFWWNLAGWQIMTLETTHQILDIIQITLTIRIWDP